MSVVIISALIVDSEVMQQAVSVSRNAQQVRVQHHETHVFTVHLNLVNGQSMDHVDNGKSDARIVKRRSFHLLHHIGRVNRVEFSLVVRTAIASVLQCRSKTRHTAGHYVMPTEPESIARLLMLSQSQSESNLNGRPLPTSQPHLLDIMDGFLMGSRHPPVGISTFLRVFSESGCCGVAVLHKMASFLWPVENVTCIVLIVCHVPY